MRHSEQAFRAIPSVEKLVQALGEVGLPRPLVVDLGRRLVADLRKKGKTLEFDEVVNRLRGKVENLSRSRIQPVINGTGVIVHTNLGRAPLGTRVWEELTSVASGYCNLEYDLDAGERGDRGGYLEYSLAQLCQAEAATVVNNCAAALVLMLRHFTSGKRKKVVISRGELVQIGGGFRIPEILESSGAKLSEVGTTNKTTVADYESAIGPKTALILKVHRSNFFMGGFVDSVATEELARLARKHHLPFVEDLGSGAMAEPTGLSLEDEPTPAALLRQGVHLVCFSGDKLFGGPQAGIIVGQAKRVAALKREPFFRALRCDKLILAALQATVDTHLNHPTNRGSASAEALPIFRMIGTSLDALRVRAEGLTEKLCDLPLEVAVESAEARIGGGTLPRVAMESLSLRLKPRDLDLEEFASRLRTGTPAVIGYVSRDAFTLDLRTVFPQQDDTLTQVLRSTILPGA